MNVEPLGALDWSQRAMARTPTGSPLAAVIVLNWRKDCPLCDHSGSFLLTCPSHAADAAAAAVIVAGEALLGRLAGVPHEPQWAMGFRAALDIVRGLAEPPAQDGAS